MSWITDIGNIGQSYLEYDLNKSKIKSEANATSPTQNTRAIDRSISESTTHNQGLGIDKNILIFGGAGFGVLVLILLLKK